MPGAKLTSAQRLSLVVETQREITAAGDDLQHVMELVAERSQAITGADGAMVHAIDGDMLHTRVTTGIARRPLEQRRPIATSVSRYAIESRRPVLIENAREDPRVNQESRRRIGQESMICVPLLHGDEVVATLNVLSARRDRQLSEDDREVLEMLSFVLGAAVSRASELEARQAEAVALRRLKTLLDGASLGIMRLDRHGQIIEANPALEQMLEAPAEKLIGGRFSDHLVAEHRMTVDALVRDLRTGERESFDLEARRQTVDGALIWWHVRAVLERNDQGAAPCVIAMLDDVSERKRDELELVRQATVNEYQALHDPLNGLPNRLLFAERIGQAIRHARRDGSQLAVLLIDLDRFKEVNDTLGHPAGDRLLIEVSERIGGVLRDSDTLARLGGDEFGVLLPGLAGADGVLPVLARIGAVLERPIMVHALPLAVEASIGAAMFPADGVDAEVLIQRADVAMYEAKREGATLCFYDRDSHRYDVNRLTLVGELRRAIQRGELILHYQPKATLKDAVVRSVEALVRWQHPTRGLILPDAFIPVAQETGLIGPLTLHVLELALRQGRAWRDAGRPLPISANLSIRNLLDRDFPNHVAELLARFGMPAELLELEVTESSMLANPKRAKDVLGALSALGLRLSVDDYGTGFSSLSYLRELPIDEIKIDRSFVTRMNDDEQDAAIVRSTIDLGRNLGLDVVAEGVETREVWDRLRELGCLTAQGYYLSRPVPAEQLSAWLRAHEQSATVRDGVHTLPQPPDVETPVTRGAA